jgi:hypothetical protein
MAKPKTRPDYYAVLLVDSRGRWCEILSFARWPTALERLATARRGGWNAVLAKTTIAGVPRSEIERLGLRS